MLTKFRASDFQYYDAMFMSAERHSQTTFTSAPVAKGDQVMGGFFVLNINFSYKYDPVLFFVYYIGTGS